MDITTLQKKRGFCCFFNSDEQGECSHSESNLSGAHFYLVLFRLSRGWIQINAMKFAFEIHVCVAEKKRVKKTEDVKVLSEA